MTKILTSSFLFLATVVATATAVTPAGAATDTAPPVITAFDFTPKTVDVSTGAKTITVTAHLTDETGVQAPNAIAFSDDDNESTGLGQMTLTAGTAQDGDWTRTITIPATARPGTWSVALYPLRDKATPQNVSSSFTYHPDSLTVVNPGADVAPPVVTDLDFSPKTVDVSSTARNVTVLAHVTDATGTQAPIVYAVRDSNPGDVLGLGEMTLASGTAQDGDWRRTISIPTTAAAGRWSVVLASPRDTKNNTGDPLTAPVKLKVLKGADTPDAPSGVGAAAGDGTAIVWWDEPDANGSPVTDYVIKASPGGATRTVGASNLSTSFEGLDNGQAYTFTVQAVNAAGTSSASTPSTAVMPVGRPDVPTKPQAVAGDGTATVSWTAPFANGTDVTGYTVTAYPGGTTTTVVGDATSAKVDGLVNGTAYSFTVEAHNAIGTGHPSAPSDAVVPAGVPGQVAKPSAKAGSKSASVSWKAPSANGSAITGYQVRSSTGKTVKVSGSKRSIKVTGLKKGAKVSFTVRAVNLVGAGSSSSSSSKVKIK